MGPAWGAAPAPVVGPASAGRDSVAFAPPSSACCMMSHALTKPARLASAPRPEARITASKRSRAERQHAARGHRAEHHRADDGARGARRRLHVERRERGGSVFARPPAGAPSRIARRPGASSRPSSACGSAEVTRNVRSALTMPLLHRAHGLEQFRRDDEIDAVRAPAADSARAALPPSASTGSGQIST